MALHSFLRSISLLAVLCFAVLLPNATAERAAIFSFGFAHYSLSFIYAGNQLRRVGQHPRALLACLGLMLVSAGLYASGLPLLLYFAVHHVFNEVYLLSRAVPLNEDQAAKRLRLCSILLNFCLYGVLLRHRAEVSWIDARLLFAALAMAYLSFFVALWRMRSTLTPRQLGHLCVFELLGLLLVPVSFWVRIDFLLIVLYHFVFWGLYPLPKLQRQGPGAMLRYVGMNLLVSILFLWLSPLGNRQGGAWASVWNEQFLFWSYLHITLSFALSTAQPAWITRSFQPAPQALRT